MNCSSVKYDPIRSGLGAGNVQDAIDNLAESAMHVYKGALSTNDDLNDVFEEGLYSYTATCANVPYAMQTSNTYAGRLIVFHTTDAHITQIALPNQKYYDVYLRHYSDLGDGYSWSLWYPITFNQYRQSLSAVPYSYSIDFLVRFCGRSINPANFPNSTFEITAISRSGHVGKFAIVMTNSTATITRIDGNIASVHPDVRKTQSNTLYVRMVDDSSETQPSSTESIDIRVEKIR